jgi:hypothetical protein
MLRHLNMRGLNGIVHLSANNELSNIEFPNLELAIDLTDDSINVKEKRILHCKLYTVKSAQVNIILCCPCYMPKYVPRLEGIMQTRRVCFGSALCLLTSALCLLTLGRISAYNMDNTILLYKYDVIMTSH